MFYVSDSNFYFATIIESRSDFSTNIHPNDAKAGGLQSQGAKGEAVVALLRTLGNAGSEVLRLSRRVKKMKTNRSILRILRWLNLENSDKSDLD
jgi:hypothetical protein